MIGRLQGVVLAKQPPQVLIDVNGIGYEVEAPMSTFYDLPAVGEPVTLITHLVVREDAHLLYGFLHERERALFRALLRVSGVGARMALGILSGMEVERFADCVERADSAALSRLPGIGPKTASRLIVEMKDRIARGDGLPGIGPGGVGMPATDRTAAGGSAPNACADAISALIALGYKPAEATRMARAADDGARATEEIIRAALKGVG